MTVKQAATMANVSVRLVQYAGKIRREAPDLEPFIESGEMSIAQALRELKRRQQPETGRFLRIKFSRRVEKTVDVPESAILHTNKRQAEQPDADFNELLIDELIRRQILTRRRAGASDWEVEDVS